MRPVLAFVVEPQEARDRVDGRPGGQAGKEGRVSARHHPLVLSSPVAPRGRHQVSPPRRPRERLRLDHVIGRAEDVLELPLLLVRPLDRRRQVGRIPFRCPGVHPRHDGLDLLVAQPPVILDVLDSDPGVEVVRRHEALRDQVPGPRRVAADLLVRHERHRAHGRRSVADLAVGLEDGGDILAEGHLGLVGASVVGGVLLGRGGSGGHQGEDGECQGGARDDGRCGSHGVRRMVRADRAGSHGQILLQERSCWSRRFQRLGRAAAPLLQCARTGPGGKPTGSRGLPSAMAEAPRERYGHRTE